MTGIEDCLLEVMAIPGALGAMLVDHASGTAVAHHGLPDPERSASGLSETFRAAQIGLALASPVGAIRVDDIIVTTDQEYQLIKSVSTPHDGPLLICVRLDLDRANLGLARYRLQALTHAMTSRSMSK